MKTKQELIYWWLPLIALCLIAFWIQANSYLDADLAIITHTATLMLNGQTYAHDIFEPNPPLIFYLHIPAILIAKITGIKIIYVLRLYLITVIVFSVACSQYFFRKLFQDDARRVYLMSYALAFILLFLPIGVFGQREHFLLILTMPYILLAACRLDNNRLDNKPIKKSYALLYCARPHSEVLVPSLRNTWMCFTSHKDVLACLELKLQNVAARSIIGLMAGIGFSIKPFFLPTLFLIELLFVIRKKSLLGWLRIESVAASLFILLYGLSVMVFFPMYWQFVLPLWIPYYRAMMQPLGTLLTYPYFLFCCAALVFSYLPINNEQNAAIRTLLRLVVIGYLLSFLAPRVTWYYHILPAFSMSCLYLVLILAELADKVAASSARVVDWTRFALLAIVVFYMPVYSSVLATVNMISYFHGDSSQRQIAAFFDQHAPNATYDFFSMTLPLYDLEYYAAANYIGSLSFFYWEYNRLAPQRYSMSYREKTLSYMLNIVSHDLDDKKPQFVIVDIPSSQYRLHQRIDYPKEYASNKQFRSAWAAYAYATTIGPYEIYQRKSF